MNASRLREIVDLLLELETRFQIQTRLNEANGAIQNMISQPQNPDFQTQFSSTLDQLRVGASQIGEELQPTQISRIVEIGGEKFFVDDLAALIDDWTQKNRVTPAVIQQNLQRFLAERQNYIELIARLRDSLNSVGIKAITLGEGDAEVGILLPRDLFNNELESLIKELGEIRFIFRAFSELATGSAERIEVRQISTSDPQFFFHLNPMTIALLGGAVTWVLNTWKQVEDIRKVRAEARKRGAFSEREVEDIFDKKIRSTIESAVEAKTEDLVAQIVDKSERAREQRQHLKISLESLLARIERGMTVEIRCLAPPKEIGADETTGTKPEAFDSINKIIPELVFPKSTENPVLPLPHAEEK